MESVYRVKKIKTEDLVQQTKHTTAKRELYIHLTNFPGFCINNV